MSSHYHRHTNNDSGEFQILKDYDTKAGTLVGYVTLMIGLVVGLGTFTLLDKLTKLEYIVPFFARNGPVSCYHYPVDFLNQVVKIS